MTKRSITLLLLIVLLSSCKKEELVYEIVLDAQNTMEIEVNSGTDFIGASCLIDNCEIKVLSDLDSFEIGEYQIDYVYLIDDLEMNKFTQNITVVDNTSPELILIGDSIVYLELGESYNDLGVECFDNYDLDSIVFSDDLVNSEVGEYILNYYATDTSGNESTIQRTVIVTDSFAPDFLLIGSDIILEYGEEYIELGLDCFEECSITTTSNIDFSKLGEYIIEYDSTDTFGNHLIRERRVTVVDTTAPKGELVGKDIVSFYRFDTYIEQGVTCTDNYDVECTIEITNNIDNAIYGRYLVEYNLTDSSNNTTTISRIVVVSRKARKLVPDSTLPVVTLNGIQSMTIELGNVFIDPYAICTDNSNYCVITIEGDVLDEVGEYSITYTATDKSENNSRIIRTVNVVDTTIPSLLITSGVTVFEAGSFNLDLGVVCADLSGCTVTSSINFDKRTVGNYQIEYSAVDESGNTVSGIKEIKIIDTTNPEFDEIMDQTIDSGGENIDWSSLILNETDNSDSVLIKEELIDGVTYNKPGVYSVSVKVTDNSQNVGVRTFKVTVNTPEAAFTINNSGLLLTYNISYGLDIAIPNTVSGIVVKEITSFFLYNKGITSVVLPSRLESIGFMAFEGNNLTNIVLPNGLLRIDSAAFKDNLITMLEIPASVGFIDMNVFRGNNIEIVTILGDSNRFNTSWRYIGLDPGINDSFILEDNYYFYPLTKAIIGFDTNSGVQVIIPSIIDGVNVERIGISAFSDLGINSVGLPSGILEIGDHAFSGNNLSIIVVPNSITKIGTASFMFNSLTEIVIPASVTEIGQSAFSGNSLISITIGGYELRFNNTWETIGFPKGLKPTV